MFAYCQNNPINRNDAEGAISNWTKIAIGVGFVLIGAAVVAATAATGGTAAVFFGAAVSGLKAAAISGAVASVIGAGTKAVSHRVSSGSWAGAGSEAWEGAKNGFADGFMTGGILAGAGMTYGALTKTFSGIQFGKTIKPQYGRVNIGYGTPKTNGNTIISIQNNAGRSIFRLDVDALHSVHMHIPSITKEHIPIGSIVAGIASGIRQLLK